ncbi:hypothetical protein Trydic_g17435 [Trypoxylus dichotomus]
MLRATRNNSDGSSDMKNVLIKLRVRMTFIAFVSRTNRRKERFIISQRAQIFPHLSSPTTDVSDTVALAASLSAFASPSMHFRRMSEIGGQFKALDGF